MHFSFRTFLFLLLIQITAACEHIKHNDLTQVQSTIYSLIQADNRSDINAVMNCYADSITFYPTGRASISGMDAIRKNYEELFTNHKLKINTVIIEAKVFDEEAYVRGVNLGTKINLADGSVQEIRDNYIALLVKYDTGKWKITKLMWGF